MERRGKKVSLKVEKGGSQMPEDSLKKKKKKSCTLDSASRLQEIFSEWEGREVKVSSES